MPGEEAIATASGNIADVILYGSMAILAFFILYYIYRRLQGSGDYFHTIIFEKKKIYSKTFNKNKFRNFCGVEIECIKDKNEPYFNKKDLKDYNFSQGRDGSLSLSGVEFMSQPSRGDHLLKMIKKFTDELNKKNYYVNRSCGLHTHIEVPIKLGLIKKMYIFYSKFEDLFFKMLPKSRQNLKYCEKFRKLDDYDWEDVSEIRTLDDFKKLYYETNYYETSMEKRYVSKRYCWVNFHSLFYRGTIEMRAHSGTIEYEKIANWLLIHLSIINFLKKTEMNKIVEMKVTKENFLKIFTPKIKNYIKLRWEKFPRGKEEDLQCVKCK